MIQNKPLKQITSDPRHNHGFRVRFDRWRAIDVHCLRLRTEVLRYYEFFD